TTSAGTLTATAVDDNGPNIDTITVNPGLSVQSTGGDVQFAAGDDIVINATAVVQAPTGNIDFRSGFGDTDNEGITTINGTVVANNNHAPTDISLGNASVQENQPAGTLVGAF